MNKSDLIYYEISSSWWAPWISNNFLQGLVAQYFVWKIKIKLNRYENFIKLKELGNYKLM